MSEMTLLRLDQVKAKTGLCRSAVYALPDFPKSVKLGGRRAVGWLSSEVDAWILKTVAASRQAGGDEQAA
jgi:prophage regulatory protein